ncbi:MAG: ribonuclease III [Clostridia bacterium]|nr:ribonuclease III [Clostridia bacterium]
MSSELDLNFFPHGQKPGSLELAFVGDAVYELFVRAQLTLKGGKANALSDLTVAKVRASAQAASLARVLPVLTDDEKAIVRRARNAKQTPPKHADPVDYHDATALEAVMGYLYLTQQTGRLNELLRLAADMEGNL